MEDKKNAKQGKKGFFARLMDKVDQKMQEKVKSSGCCSCSCDSGSKDKKC
ncbi:MAG: hypothetical protein HQL16_03670 [Candidatus Omnitrophica bacterium]|nr:hypothetical protein [Candidatus Omnitrophota bacterium]